VADGSSRENGVQVTIGGGEDYLWLEDWAEVPEPDEARVGWAHHGLAVTRAGEVVAFHPERPEVLLFDREGRLARSLPVALKEGHGLTLVEEAGAERLFVADPGSKMRRAPDGSYRADVAAEQGQVVKLDLEGNEIVRLARPPHPSYETGRYAPTSVAVDEVRHGGSGDIWVADGYGQSLVHRYDADGAFLATLTGEEGAGRFNCPHAVFIDRRRGDPELLVADRGNARVQVYDLAGSFRRSVGESVLNSPSVFAVAGENLVVGELRARLAVLGPDEQLLGYLGENGEVCDLPGWPNGVDDDQHPVRRPDLRPGRFNSPHGLAADADGNLYVAEWLIGGRMIKLNKAGA
jgi:hypothetical protein